MRYVLMFKSEQPAVDGRSPCKAELPEMAKAMAELREQGVLVGGEGLMPPERGARVRYDGGKLPVLDGPFAEAKELVAGFAIVDVVDKAQAVRIAQRFLGIAGEGTCDVLEVFEPRVPHA